MKNCSKCGINRHFARCCRTKGGEKCEQMRTVQAKSLHGWESERDSEEVQTWQWKF